MKSITGNFSPSLALDAERLANEMPADAEFCVLPVGEFGSLYIVRDPELLHLQFAEVTTDAGERFYIGGLLKSEPGNPAWQG